MIRAALRAWIARATVQRDSAALTTNPLSGRRPSDTPEDVNAGQSAEERLLFSRDLIVSDFERLLEEINLDDADAGRFRLAPHLGGVLAGLENRDKCRFQVVARLQSGRFHLCLLAASVGTHFPVVVLQHNRAILVSQLKGRVRQRVCNTKSS